MTPMITAIGWEKELSEKKICDGHSFKISIE
jgi:hypothetical protein